MRKAIDKISSELNDVLDEIEKLKQDFVPLYKKERMLKEKTTVKEGVREGNAGILSALKNCQKEINHIKRNKIQLLLRRIEFGDG